MTSDKDAPASSSELTELLLNFEYGHLPQHLADVSQQFRLTAHLMSDLLPDTAELRAGLRKLLESKDCMVRCQVAQHRRPPT